MSVAIYDAYQSGNTAAANALVVILSLTALLVLFLMNRAGERQSI